MSLIHWYSKKQSTVESSVFGMDFVATKVGMDTLHIIQYKLRMMSIPITGPPYIHGDNMLKPESTLNKKCDEIAYLAILKSVAII